VAQLAGCPFGLVEASSLDDRPEGPEHVVGVALRSHGEANILLPSKDHSQGRSLRSRRFAMTQAPPLSVIFPGKVIGAYQGGRGNYRSD
jgi:hypothetical protein